MTAFERDDLFTVPNETLPRPDKPVPPAWNVVIKKKPAKPKEPEAEKTPSSLPVACKFFKLGKCAAGKGCRFSHDPNAPIAPESDSAPSTPTLPCKFHALGYCRNGPKCPFLHATTKKSAPAPVLAPAPSIPVTKPSSQHNGVQSTPTPIMAIINNHPTTTTSHPIITASTTSTMTIMSNNSLFPSMSFHGTSTKQQTSPIPTSSPIRSILADAPFPIARSPTTTQHHTSIMNIWPASPPVSNMHSVPFFSSSPSSAPSSFSPRHMASVIPSLASLPSSPSFLSSSPFSMFMSTKPEEDEDDDDELLPISGLTIIDDTQDHFIFNPYDDILNTDDDFQSSNGFPSHTTSTDKANGIRNHTSTIPTYSQSSPITTHPPTINSSTSAATSTTTTNPSSPTLTPEEGLQQRTFADIVKINNNTNTNINTITSATTNTTVTKSTHLLEEEGELDEMNNRLCQFFMQGNCRYGSTCRYIHGNMCDSCNKPCLLPDNPQQNEEHILSCTMHVKMLEERGGSKDVDCGICYERTVDKGRRFGLLSHCDHPFCLDCIREWRGGTGAPTTTLRSCPICRVTSYYIIPSEGMIFDPERKKDIIEQYKSKLTTITCKYFNNGKGVCKFGSSCMYSHTNPDGTPYAPPTPRKMQDAEGEVTFYNGLKLGAFFDVM